MGQGVKLSIELAHGDGLWVENVCEDLLKGDTPGGRRPLQSGQSVSEDLIAPGLAGDGGSHQHEPMAHHSRFVELDTLANEPWRMEGNE